MFVKQDLHQKSHRRDDSTCVIRMGKFLLSRILHCYIDDDPPTSEELAQDQNKDVRKDEVRQDWCSKYKIQFQYKLEMSTVIN